LNILSGCGLPHQVPWVKALSPWMEPHSQRTSAEAPDVAVAVAELFVAVAVGPAAADADADECCWLLVVSIGLQGSMSMQKAMCILALSCLLACLLALR